MNELFSHYIRSNDAVFKHARGKSAETGKEFHTFHEIIYFMDGDAEFIGEDIHTKVTAGTLIIVPRKTYHQLVIHGNRNDYCRCTLNFEHRHYCEESMGTQTLVQADRNTEYLFRQLIVNYLDENAPAMLDAVLTLLLSDLRQKEKGFAGEGSQNAVVQSAVQFINENLYSKISVDRIAKKCMISPSSVSHIFKKEMGISLHRFIIRKRLINAYQKIEAGEPATLVAIECGFNDYSGFYKQYKKMFGMSPSAKKQGTSKE